MHALLRWCAPLILFCLPLTTSAITLDEGRGLCRSIYFFESWEYSPDQEVEKIAREIIEKAGHHFVPVVCVGDGGRHTLAGSKRMEHGGRSYYVMGFNREFRRHLGENLRGVIAHEVAHASFPDGLCFGGSIEDYTACELGVDKEGERIVGKGVIARAHEAILRIIEKTRVPPTENDLITLRILRARRDALREGK